MSLRKRISNLEHESDLVRGKFFTITKKNQEQIEQLEKTNKTLAQQIEQLENQIQCSHKFTIEYTFENGNEIWGQFVCDFCDFEMERKLTPAEIKATETLNL